MEKLKFGICATLSLTLVILGNRRIGMYPPIGKFFSPFWGYWQNVERTKYPPALEKKILGLKDRVEVYFDKNLVPHIFAQNEEDAYFMQGYITAYHRLWQMEFQTRVVAGELAEVLGEKALKFDIRQRRFGFLRAAKKSLKIFFQNPDAKRILLAYTAGVNAYIRSLRPHQYPLEYKIFDYAPRLWSPLRSALVLKYMDWLLTLPFYNQREIELSKVLKKFGAKVANQIFPTSYPNPAPVIPLSVSWNFSPSLPKAPSSVFVPSSVITQPLSELGIGSNNWAFSGKKTATGAPLLASDPHLPLTLPSIWYELQMHTPFWNVYGVSLPGSPFVIIGFNEHSAWAMTNAQTDVADWYELEFKDNSYKEYKYGKKWRKVKILHELIRVRGGKSRKLTIHLSHYGPVIYKLKGTSPPKGLALRWVGYEGGEEVLALWKLNRARHYKDYRKALKHYSSPAQNFLFATQDGDIGISHYGRFPIRWPDQGKFISNGSDPTYEWKGFIPHPHLPHVRNPKEGFVFSVNQPPVGKGYPYFLTGYYEPYRHKRLKTLMESIQKATLEDCLRLQEDTKNLHAASIMPALLKTLEKKLMSHEEQKVYQILRKWDCHDRVNSIASTVFDKWWRLFHKEVWEDEFGKKIHFLPTKLFTVNLALTSPNSLWFDDIRTEERENFSQIAWRSFQKTVKALKKQLGPIGDSWQWGKARKIHIPHIAKLPGFGQKGIEMGGNLHELKTCTQKFSTSWRMIVSLENPVKAWGIYPGGQSGNPASAFYDNGIKDWKKGKLRLLRFFQKLPTNLKGIAAVWRLSPLPKEDGGQR